MLYAVISDIHANLEALEVVLDHIRKQNINNILCLGDIVGYGASPNECCELLLELNPKIIMGNHDRAAFDLEEAKYFNTYARNAAIWTNEALDDKYKNILRNLDEQMLVDNNLLLVHGAIDDRNGYILEKYQADKNITLLKENYPHINICFFGHSHMRQIWGPVEGTPFTTTHFHLSNEDSYLINPGSVGQPRDGDNSASYATYDTESMELNYHYFAYDIEKARNKILNAGLPSYLADRLLRGA